MKKIYLFFLFILSATNFAFQSPNTNNVIAKNGATEGGALQRLNQSTLQLIEKNQLLQAEKEATEALKLSKIENSVLGNAVALDNLGLIAEARFDYTNAMNYFVEALKLKQTAGDNRGVAISKNNIGKVFHLQSNENQALTNYDAALGLLTGKISDMQTSAETHYNIGDVFLSQKFYGKAIQEFDKALKIWSEDLQDFHKSASLAFFLGKINIDLKDNDGALNNFNASLNFHRMLNDEIGMANDFLYLSKVYNEQADTDLSIENANKALALYEKSQNVIGLAEVNCQLGSIYLKNKNTKLATAFFEKSGSLLRGVKFQPTVPLLFKNIADGYLQLGDFLKAYDYLSDYATSRDSLFNNEKSRALVDMTTKYESEFAVKDKNRQLAIFAKEKSEELFLRWLLVGFASLILIALWLTFKNYRIKKQDNEKLSALNGQIKVQNKVMAMQNDSLEQSNIELNEKNLTLDTLNSRLVEVISEKENAQNTNFSKDNYLVDVSARMGDSLTTIVKEASILMADQPRKTQEQPIRNLQFATNTLLVLINDVLDFSNIEAGKVILKSHNFDTLNVFEEIKNDFKPKANVSFEMQFHQELPVKLKGDVVRFTQILTYLIKGLQRQLKKGVIDLSASTETINQNEVMMKIEILAMGSVEQNEFIPLILENQDFRELIRSLSLEDMEWLTARRLIELQNGTIGFSGQETSLLLTIVLPFKLVVVDAQEFENTEGSLIWANNNFLEGKRILIAEDNKINQMLVVNMLKKCDVLVTVANDGLEALEALAESDFDLILMDIQMPRMDGYRAVSEIRHLKNPIKSGVPIIALTASTYIDEKEKAQLFGMTDHIGKPFSPDELMEKVIRVLMSAKQKVNKPLSIPA